MKEQFFEPLQPDKGSNKKLLMFIFICVLMSVLFCIVLDENGVPIFIKTDIEAWKAENSWLFGDATEKRIQKGLKDGSLSLIFHSQWEYEKWKKSNARTDSGYPVPTDNQLYHALERIESLEDSQLILQRKYDSLNKKFEQWRKK